MILINLRIEAVDGPSIRTIYCPNDGRAPVALILPVPKRD